MSINEKDLNDFKTNNAEKIKNATNIAKSALGKDADKVTAILNDPEKLMKIANQLSKSDLEKMSKLLDNPEAIKKMLTNDKAKANLKKMAGE